MSTDFFAALGFILISTFTPGPNNISSAAMGTLHGFKSTWNYLLGIAGGFFIVMLICAVASASLLTIFPGLETILRYVGAVYLLYLAFGILKATYTFETENVKPLAFSNGVLLQLLNPKLIIYGLTLFSTFFAPIASQPGLLIITVILLTLISLCSTSLWASSGTFIKRYMHHPRVKLVVNVVLSLSLVYTALELARIL
jgi:cysteine/O-acetylserine efflux protein